MPDKKLRVQAKLGLAQPCASLRGMWSRAAVKDDVHVAIGDQGGLLAPEYGLR